MLQDQTNTAPAAARTPSEIIHRELLWSGGVIEVKPPKEAALKSAGDLKFINFWRTVRGGSVNLFVHGSDQIDPVTYRGKKIFAKVEVWRKDLADERSFLYVDLKPTDERPTCRLIVESGLSISIPKTEEIFTVQTPKPLSGIVVIAKLKPEE